ncbi:MAG: Hpt domain protein [Hyphomicrobiales bacterium]|nr:Hpt domain protein [Hyphomicrobiales bacterium]
MTANSLRKPADNAPDQAEGAAPREAMRLSPTTRGSRERPIDLVRLSLHTLGDRALEVELLQLFDAQSEQIVARLPAFLRPDDRRIMRDFCHTLKGSARAVGAGRVASAAGEYEDALAHAPAGADLSEFRQEVCDAVAEARDAIAQLLG